MKLEVDISCPSCKRKFKQRLGDMRPGNTRKCPGCGKVLHFDGDDMSKTQRAVDDLERELKKIGS